MEQIEIEYSLDKETLQKAYTLHFTPKGWKRFIPFLYIAILLFILFGTFPKNETIEPISFSISIFFWIVLILGITWYVTRVFLPKRWANTLLNNGIASGIQKWVLRNDGIVFTGPKSVANLNWTYFSKIIIKEEIIALYPNGATIVIIPVSVFTPEQFLQFKVWAQANVKEVIE